jgi:3'(2'), 5'-bisphosphate nucleotidase
MIDPVDGTKGFLSGGQFVVCVTLLVEGAEKMAAFGCPHVNLDSGRISESETDTNGAGVLVSAIKGQGADVRPLSNGKLLPAKPVAERGAVEDLSKIRFCENVNTTTPQFRYRDEIAHALGAKFDPVHIYSTQLRYLALTLGAAEVVLRTPLPEDAPPHIWDHAGGVMMFEEVGGKVTDLNGKLLDFTAGRDLVNNFGLIAAPASIHHLVVEATQATFRRYKEYAGVIDAVTEEQAQ